MVKILASVHLRKLGSCLPVQNIKENVTSERVKLSRMETKRHTPLCRFSQCHIAGSLRRIARTRKYAVDHVIVWLFSLSSIKSRDRNQSSIRSVTKWSVSGYRYPARRPPYEPVLFR
jgi:hypothetical protein